MKVLLFILPLAFCSIGCSKNHTHTDDNVHEATHLNQNATVEHDQGLAASQILIAYRGAASAKATITRAKDEAFQKAWTLARRLESDPSLFEKLAREESDGLYSERGGYLGSWEPGTMVPAFEQAVEQLEIGAITREPVETVFGYFLIRREAIGE